jgi:hypothetical protein
MIPRHDEPVWRAALRAVGNLQDDVDLAGWAGQARAVGGGPVALSFFSRLSDPKTSLDEWRWIAVARIDQDLSSPFDRAAVRYACANLAPGIAPT